MASDVIFLNRASADLAQLTEYLSECSPISAKTYVADLKGACLGLSDYPEKAPRYSDRYRMLVVRNHIVFYRYDADRRQVLIARIIDGRRNIDSIMRTSKRHHRS